MSPLCQDSCRMTAVRYTVIGILFWGFMESFGMTRYSTAVKQRMVRRLSGASAISAMALARETGIQQTVLSRWLREARSVEPMADTPKKKWTGAEKLRVVIAARGLSDSELGALLRHEGIFETDLVAWQAVAEAALSDVVRRPGDSDAVRRIQALERELQRKDAALAETAALIVLKKKAQAIWGDGDDVTPPRREP
jgi:transposase